MPYGLAKFKRYSINVWDVNPTGMTDEEIANEGLCRMEAYMKEIGVAMEISSLGVTEEMLEGIAEHVLVMDGGYKALTNAEILQVLTESMREKQ